MNESFCGFGRGALWYQLVVCARVMKFQTGPVSHICSCWVCLVRIKQFEQSGGRVTLVAASLLVGGKMCRVSECI